MNKKLLDYFDKQIKLEHKIRKIENKYKKEIEKNENKLNNIKNNIINIQEEIIDENNIKKELEKMITNSVKKKNAKITIPIENEPLYIENEPLYMICLNSNNFNICYGGDMRQFRDKVNIKKIDKKYIYLKSEYYSNLKKILIKHFTENENIDKDIFLKFLEFSKEYIEESKRPFIPEIKMINKKVYIDVSKSSEEETKNKLFVDIINNSKRKNKLTKKQKEIIVKYIEEINERQKTIKDLMKRIKEFNMPIKIIKQLTK